ncbi:hypothetical protein Trydic_g13581 [Trypoxylus dichotomus]
MTGVPADDPEDNQRRISKKYLARNKMTSRKGSPSKSHRPGRLTRNPFLNFLREYRRTHCNMSMIQIACEGAKEWRSMTDEQKQQYARRSKADPRRGKRSKTSRGSAPKSVSPRESKSPRRSMSKSA